MVYKTIHKNVIAKDYPVIIPELIEKCLYGHNKCNKLYCTAYNTSSCARNAINSIHKIFKI